MSDQPIHATTLALYRQGQGWFGVLVTGPSGAGKSDLALRLMSRGWRLVADDYTQVFASGGRIYATAPATIAGRMEVRGIGVVGQTARTLAQLGLVVELQNARVERLPEPRIFTLGGIDLACVSLCGLEPSAVEKVTVLSRRL